MTDKISYDIELMCPNCSLSRKFDFPEPKDDLVLSCPECFIHLLLVTERRESR